MIQGLNASLNYTANVMLLIGYNSVVIMMSLIGYNSVVIMMYITVLS